MLEKWHVQKLDSKYEAARKSLLKQCTLYQKKLSESGFARKHESANLVAFTV